jgi:hypothetical protein
MSASQALCLQPVGQLKQGRQVGCGLKPARHLRATILVEHPSRYRLPLLTEQLDVRDVVTAEFSHDQEVMSPVEGVKCIPYGNLALVTGIIASRFQPVRTA